MILHILRSAGAAAAFFLLHGNAAAQLSNPAMRTWVTTNGEQFQAALLGTQGSDALLQLANGRQIRVSRSLLTPADQAAIRMGKSAGAPPKARTWPETVEAPPDSIEITLGEQDPTKRRFVYRSRSFEFVSQDKLAGSLMKEVARTFEATHSLVSALPWGINPAPPAGNGLHQAKLFVTREDYFADGGPQNSGGVYSSKDRIFRIPFPSLGLQLLGKTWFKKADYHGTTLVHEVTHQMMHDSLPFLPKWIIEGTAEYTGSLPYNAGHFLAGSHERALKEYIARAAQQGALPAEFRPAADLLAMKRSNWEDLSRQQHAQQLLYFQSYMLVYFFCHLDGDGKGTRFFQYLDAIAEARETWTRFFKNPLVKLNPDGSYTFPNNLERPATPISEEFGIEKLDLLLEGRSPTALEKDIREGFKKIGVRL